MENARRVLHPGVFAAFRGCRAKVEFDFETHRKIFVVGKHKCPGPGSTCAFSFFNSSVYQGEVVESKCQLSEFFKEHPRQL